MPSASTTQVLAATRQWLKPLVHVLIRCGIPWKDFAELAKTAYVEVATQQFGKRGRPTNVSRTAVLTGLARREVRKQRERIEATPDTLTGYVTKASLVLSAWHQDPEFLEANGKPALLPVEGDRRSFTALLRRCGASDVRPTTLLKELRSAGAVEETADGRLQALKRVYIPHAMEEHTVRLWARSVAGLATTAAHNLMRHTDTPPRFERVASNDRIDPGAVAEFQEFLNREGQAFLERVDAWLSAHQIKTGAAGAPGTSSPAAGSSGETREAPERIRLGAGVYHIQD